MYQKSQSCNVCFLRHGVQQTCDVWFLGYGLRQTEFLAIFSHFWPFYPTNNPKNQNFAKMKTMPGGIIILNKHTWSQDHMLYCSWDMVYNRCNYFSFWAIFCPFIPLPAWKIKILKKWKRHMEMSSFYTSVSKIMIICYTDPEIWHVTDIIIFHFELFLPFYQNNSPKNFKKMKETLDNIIILHRCTKNNDHINGQTDGQMDRQKKWHIEVAVQPKNKTADTSFLSYWAVYGLFSTYKGNTNFCILIPKE